MLNNRARIAALVLLLLPTPALAEWLFTPAVGGTFGGDTFSREHPTFGAAVAWRDEEAFGWEVDLWYSPEFFEGVADGGLLFNGSGRVVTIMGNGLIGLGSSARFQPYLTGGVGLMQMHVISDLGNELFDTTTYETGFNLGLGVMAFATDRVGVRGDMRYVRSFQNQVPSWTQGTDLDVAPGNFDFWRATVGVTVRIAD